MQLDPLQALLKDSLDEFNRSQSESMRSVSAAATVFEVFFRRCQHLLDQLSGHYCTFQDMKSTVSTKHKGDVFELFCQRYLLIIMEYEQVWLLRELTDELKQQLRLPKCHQDYGIDMVAFKHGQYSAVQCKFKAPRARCESPIAKANPK